MIRHTPRPSSRRRRRPRRTRAPLAAALVISASILGALLAFAGIQSPGDSPDPAPSNSRSMPRISSTDEGSSANGGIYPYSVVPGGVRTLSRLRQAVASDPVVASHYATVAIGRARFTRVSAPRLAYVSYRMNDRIYWTKRPVPLHAGEGIVTDGVSEIRARCGNRISEHPMEPTSSDEPPIVEFERVLAPPAPADVPDVAEFDAAVPPVPQSVVILPPSAPPVIRSINVGGPLGVRVPDRRSSARDEDDDPPGDPPPSVPEPASILLLGAAVASYALRKRRRSRNGTSKA